MAPPATTPTILIAEDDPHEIVLLTSAFSKTGLNCKLQFVSNGRDAKAYLEGHSPYHDRETFPMPLLLLLDLGMRVVDGYEFLNWLKTQPHLRDLTVVVHSGSIEQRDMDGTANMGVKGYYVKSGTRDAKIKLFKELSRRWLEDIGPD
jgi:CheY-like chemotaxis protein